MDETPFTVGPIISQMTCLCRQGKFFAFSSLPQKGGSETMREEKSVYMEPL